MTKLTIVRNNIIIFCEDENSFQTIKDLWYKECNKFLEFSNCLKILLKTKIDNDENLNKEMKEYLKKIEAMLFETSTKENTNID